MPNLCVFPHVLFYHVLFSLKEIDSDGDYDFVLEKDVPSLTEDQEGRLQFAGQLLCHQTHRMSGYIQDKQQAAKVYQDLRGILVGKMLHSTESHKCALLDSFLKQNFQREVVDVSLDVSQNAHHFRARTCTIGHVRARTYNDGRVI